MDMAEEGADVQPTKVDEIQQFMQLGAEFSSTMTSPKLLSPVNQEFALQRIYKFVDARDSGKQFRVLMALVHIGILHGTGPNTDWQHVMFAPGGSMKTVSMIKLLDAGGIRGSFRKFMHAYGHLVDPYLEANPQVKGMLMERIVRNGVPMTSAISVVDFVLPSNDSPSGAGYRYMAKELAVLRSNGNKDNSLYSASKNAIADANNAKSSVSKSSAAQNVDHYGPL